jgi:hypothetical protein
MGKLQKNVLGKKEKHKVLSGCCIIFFHYYIFMYMLVELLAKG